jgi:hypothetical protein
MRDEPLQKLSPHSDFEKLMVCEAVSKDLTRQLKKQLDHIAELENENKSLRSKLGAIAPEHVDYQRWQSQKHRMYDAVVAFLNNPVQSDNYFSMMEFKKNAKRFRKELKKMLHEKIKIDK